MKDEKLIALGWVIRRLREAKKKVQETRFELSDTNVCVGRERFYWGKLDSAERMFGEMEIALLLQYSEKGGHPRGLTCTSSFYEGNGCPEPETNYCECWVNEQERKQCAPLSPPPR